MKAKVIKNISCMFAFALILAVFLVYYGTNSTDVASPYVLPVVMMEFVICMFSYYWSILRSDKVSNIRVGLIVALVIVAFFYIVVLALDIVIAETSTVKSVLTVLSYVFFVILTAGSLYCLFFPIYIDFYQGKKKAIKDKQ